MDRKVNMSSQRQTLASADVDNSSYKQTQRNFFWSQQSEMSEDAEKEKVIYVKGLHSQNDYLSIWFVRFQLWCEWTVTSGSELAPKENVTFIMEPLCIPTKIVNTSEQRFFCRI